MQNTNLEYGKLEVELTNSAYENNAGNGISHPTLLVKNALNMLEGS
jgi:hypothetical protein